MSNEQQGLTRFIKRRDELNDYAPSVELTRDDFKSLVSIAVHLKAVAESWESTAKLPRSTIPCGHPDDCCCDGKRDGTWSHPVCKICELESKLAEVERERDVADKALEAACQCAKQFELERDNLHSLAKKLAEAFKGAMGTVEAYCGKRDIAPDSDLERWRKALTEAKEAGLIP